MNDHYHCKCMNLGKQCPNTHYSDCKICGPAPTEARQEGGGWRAEVRTGAPWTQDGAKMLARIAAVEKAAEERAQREEWQIIAARIEVIQARANNRAEYGAVEDLGRLLSRLQGSGGTSNNQFI